MNFLHNPWIIGSLGLSAGSLLGYIRSIPGTIINLFERYFTSSIQVSSAECTETYRILRSWVHSLEYTRKTRNVTGILRDNTWVFTPAPGHHIMWFNGHLTWFRRERQQPQQTDRFSGAKQTEIITMRVFTRNRTVVEKICEEIRKFSKSLELPDQHTVIFTVRYSDWEPTGKTRKTRSLDSVIIPKSEKERILTDLSDFFDKEDWYTEIGVPYRRGWLFQGLPGTGKTSLVSALAGHYRRRIYILSLNESELTDTALLGLVAAIKPGSILLLEDIDAAFEKRENKDAKGITFSGLLNALDGVASPEGLVTIMTTNHPEKLDPALIRPGRIDQVMEFKGATEEQVRAIFKRFKPGEEVPESYVKEFVGQPLSEAQKYLLTGEKSTHSAEKNFFGAETNCKDSVKECCAETAIKTTFSIAEQLMLQDSNE